MTAVTSPPTEFRSSWQGNAAERNQKIAAAPALS